MAVDKEKSQRRVYVLPTELVERIVAYQDEHGFQSEVEAVRRLLDEALLRRDDWRSLVRRVYDRQLPNKNLIDIAKDVLVGHPLIRKLEFGPDVVAFTMEAGDRVSLFSDGSASVRTKNEAEYSVDRLGVVSPKSKDEIPF
jgi:hypothetical protein